eukprot:TRINITY_DN55_c0_g2_i1.p1 TRINITY_DN55_c0_g2~~TRINITY_DN55_c0_g2_i1.p1  ORF type:complete len:291 (-),score=15.15 TRINITY_DN55_c0_g2_i1:91-963(-)
MTEPVSSQVHPHVAQKKTFLDRVLRGPERIPVFSTFLLILVPQVLFYACVAPFLVHRLSVGVVVVALYVSILCFCNFFMAAGLDPGVILPQQSLDNIENAEQKKEVPPPKEVLVVGGIPFVSKYCTTCNIYRPPRASHCGLCKHCVSTFDHHCPAIGNCIAQRNYRFFVIFVFSTVFMAIYILAFSLANVLLIYFDLGGGGSSFNDAISKAPVACILVIYSFLAIWSPLGLCCFHLSLIHTGQTTKESLSNTFGTRTPYSQSCAKNFFNVFYSPFFPSFEKLREKRAENK